MSEDLSIDEIIARANEIKEKADSSIKEAENKLNEKAQDAIDSIDEHSTKVMESVVGEILEDESDVKTFTPKTPSVDKTQKIHIRKKLTIHHREDMPKSVSDKTMALNNIDEDDDVKVFSKEAEIEKTRPITITTKKKTNKKTQLEEIPTIMSVDEIGKSFGSKVEERDPQQMVFDGYDDLSNDADTIDRVDKIDEEEAERELQKRREEKVKKFRIETISDKEEQLGEETVENEYRNTRESGATLNWLKSRIKTLAISTALTFGISIIIFMLTLFKDKGYLPMLIDQHNGFFITALILYAVVLVLNINVIVHGFKVKKKINSDFPVAMIGVITLIYTSALLFNENLWIDNGILLTSVASFGFIISQLGKIQMMRRLLDNFEFITDGNDKFTSETIDNEVDSNIIARNVLDEDANIKISVKTDLPSHFMEISSKNEPADEVSAKTFFISIILSAIVGIIGAVMNGISEGINIAMCALCISSPAYTLFITNSVLYEISMNIAKNGARVCGYEGASVVDGADAIVIDDSDLFSKGSCSLHGVKHFNGVKINDSIVKTAALIIQSKSPLADSFEDVIVGKSKILPEIDDLMYEEGLGLSAWLYKKKIFVGTREFLQHHDIKVPVKEFEKRHCSKDRHAMYLAVDGVLWAMFVVSYSADYDLKVELKKLERSGISLMVRNSDPFLTEEELNKLFGLKPGFLHVLDHHTAKTYDKYSNMYVEKSPAYIVHNGGAKSFISAIRGADSIMSSKPLIAFFTLFGSVLSIALMGFLSVMNYASVINAGGILMFQAMWIVFEMIILRLRRIGE